MKLTALIVALIVLSFPQYAFAENGANGADAETSVTKKDVLKEHKMTIMEKKEAKMEALDAKKAAKLEVREAKREALKEKLSTMKDEQKAEVAERLDEKLEMINKNRTDRLSEKLAKLSEILGKLEAMKIEAETNGKDVSAVTAAIAAAETAIATAETAIETQAAKEYTAQVTSEATLKQNFGSVVSQLRADLQVTQKTVQAAKGAVKEAAKALRLINGGTGVSTTPEVSGTPSVSPAI